jgi:hypothetical protein
MVVAVTLLDGPDALVLFADEDATDGDGNPVRRVGGTSIPVRGSWQYDTAAESTSDGQSITSTATFRCRAFPSGFGGRVSFDERDWDVVGEPTVHGRGTFVSHVLVRLRARVPAPVS